MVDEGGTCNGKGGVQEGFPLRVRSVAKAAVEMTAGEGGDGVRGRRIFVGAHNILQGPSLTGV